MSRRTSLGIVALILVAGAGGGVACGRSAPPAAGDRPTPVYNKETGRLEQLVSDRDGDGRAETRAFMDGARLVRIEIDRNGDGRPDRWEFYRAGEATAGAIAGPQGTPPIERAEETNGATDRVTRREFYVDGIISRVEEDSDDDGRTDKWERYVSGELSTVDLDLGGHGFADRRLIYGGGTVIGVEADPEGDGVFVRVSDVPNVPEGPGRGGRKGG